MQWEIRTEQVVQVEYIDAKSRVVLVEVIALA